MNPWPIIAAALMRYRFTVLAFIVLIVAGTALSVAIISQERALRSGSAKAAEKFDVVVAPVGSTTDALMTSVYLQPGTSRLLSPEMTARVLNDDRAAFGSPMAFGDSFNTYPIVGVTAELALLLSGDELAEGAIFTRANEALVGAGVDLDLGSTFMPSHGTHVTADLDHAEGHDHDITITGRMAPTGSPWDRAIIVPVETVWAVHGLLGEFDQLASLPIGGPYNADNPGTPAAVLKAETIAGAYQLRAEYNTDESMAFFPAEVLIQLYETLGDVRQLMTLMSFVTQGLVMLAIIASVLILFRLLMPQFTTLRAIGAPRIYIFLIAWGFVAVLFTVGTLLGVGAGFALSLVISSIIEGQIGIALSPSIGQAELLLALGIWGLGLLIAVLPAAYLQRLPVAGALKAY